MKKIDIAGLNLNPIPKPELLTLIRDRIRVGERTWITTLYSEFLFAALRDKKIKDMLNQADIAIPDGIGIFWAHKFLSIPLTAKTYFGKILQSFYQAKITLLKLLFTKKDFQTIPGSELIWDIAKMAAENNLAVFLLGGYNDTPKIVSQKLKETLFDGRQKVFPDLKIAGYSSKDPNDKTIIGDINQSKADILFIAYGPIKQEEWVLENQNKLPSVKLFIGLGGSFDYIAGKRIQPPSIIRRIGLEWLFRLITQPHRIKRIYNATFGLIMALVRYKVFQSYPLRPNVVSVIINSNNKVLVCERNLQDFYIDIINSKERLKEKNYWQFPQGGIDANENLINAAKREAFEETALINLKEIYTSTQTNIYFWNSALRKFWKNRNYLHSGQKQNIVYFKYTGNDTDVKVDDHEFINFKWVPINELKNIVHQERLSLLKIVENDLKEMSKNSTI